MVAYSVAASNPVRTYSQLPFIEEHIRSEPKSWPCNNPIDRSVPDPVVFQLVPVPIRALRHADIMTPVR